MNPINHEEWDDLLESVLNGTITEEKTVALNAILKSDPSKLDDYIRYVDLHASLFRDSTLSSGDDAPIMADFPVKAGKRALSQTLIFLSGIAAAVAAVFIFNSSTRAPDADAAEQFAVESYIGLITRLDGQSVRSDALAVGRGIKLGSFYLAEGQAQIRLDNGVELSLKGPVKLDLHGPDHISLLAGKATAQVPQQAIGFRIDTPDIEIVDLGTSFALNVDASGRSSLHVIDGEVEARRHDDARAGEAPLLIARADIDKIVNRPSYLIPNYDPDTFAPAPTRDPLISGTGGMLQSLQEAPADLRNTSFSHDYIMLFPERKAVTLKGDLRVNLAYPGNYRVVRQKSERDIQKAAARDEKVVLASTTQKTLPSGSLVNSYLIHFDAPDSHSGVYRAKARVRFRQPILGVILNGEDLNASDIELGNPSTIYENHYSRETEGDLVRISADRKQIFLYLGVSNFIDQIRVIVGYENGLTEVASLDE